MFRTIAVLRVSVAASALAMVTTVAPVVALPSSSPKPVTPLVHQLTVSGIDAAAADELQQPTTQSRMTMQRSAPTPAIVALTAKQGTKPFAALGLTWDAGAPAPSSVTVRVRSNGSWGEWTDVPIDEDHAPDPESGEGERPGTEPLITGDADGVQVRVDSLAKSPSGLRVQLIDPGTSSADAGQSRPAASASAAGARPDIRTRAQWGADESLRPGSPRYGTIRVGYVHHTVNSNDYTAAQVPGIIRSIYAYHVQGRGWADIGYNFLVDKFGQIWEGRYGGIDRPVVGAHTLGFNSQSFAMSAIGNYETAAPSSAMVTAYQRLYAWKLSLHHVDPLGSTALTYNGVTTTFDNISGHRDAASTACPGRYLYAQLGTIRQGASGLQGTEMYGPRLSKSTWDYGQGGPTISTKVNKSGTWRLTAANSCAPTVQHVSSGTTAAGSLSVAWNGRLGAAFAPPGQYQLTLTFTSGSGTTLNATPVSWLVTVRESAGAPPGFCPPRLSGATRYSTAVAASQEAAPNATSIVLASGMPSAMGDALVSAPLTRATGAAFLLTRPDRLDDATVAEIKRRRVVTSATIIGGLGAVSANVESELRALGVTEIRRLGGADRYETAALVAKQLGASAPDVMLANGHDSSFADGLVLSGVAAQLRRPILLVHRDSIPPSTQSALVSLGAKHSLVAGGSGVVSNAVLAALPDATRAGGIDRYASSVAVSNWAKQHVSVDTVLVASGVQSSLVDTLSGGPLGKATVYVTSTAVPTTVKNWLSGTSVVEGVWVIGGQGVVPDVVAGEAMRAALN